MRRLWPRWSAAPARCLLFRPARRDECWYIISLIPASIYQVTCIHRHQVGDLMNGALSRPCLAAAAGLLTRESVPPPDRIFVAGRSAFDREELIHYGIHKQKKLTIDHSKRSLLVSSALWFTAKRKPGRAGRQGSVQRGGRPGQPGDALRSNKCSAHTLTARRCRPFACLFGGNRHPYVILCPCRITPTPHIACWTPSSLCCFVALFLEAPRKVLVEEPNWNCT